MEFLPFAALPGEPLKRRRARSGAPPASAHPGREKRERKTAHGPRALPRRRRALNRSEDGLGSVVTTNDPAGTVSHSVVFDAWGNTKSEIGTRQHPFTYTAREAGEAGQLFYRARHYQPSIGRFGSEDPLRFQGGSHFYAYAGSNSITMVDPMGTRFGDWWDIRSTLEFYDDQAKYSASPAAAAASSVAAALLRVAGTVESQQAGEFGGEGDYLCAAVKGALALMKGLSLAGPMLANRAGASPALVGETRRFATVSRAYWRARAGATHVRMRWHLHHWGLPQRLGGSSSGWNLLAIPARVNSYMNGRPSTMWAEQLIRTIVGGSPFAAATGGGLLGYLNERCNPGCE